MVRNRMCWAILLVIGCQTTEKISVPPLPQGGEAIPFADVSSRLRSHASTATEAFFQDKWEDVISSARLIEQTSGYLGKAPDVPPRLKERIEQDSQQLLSDAKELADAAAKSDVKRTNDSLSRIQLQIRNLTSSK